MLRKIKGQIPGEPLVAGYNWCQGPVPGRGPAVEKHLHNWLRQRERYVEPDSSPLLSRVAPAETRGNFMAPSAFRILSHATTQPAHTTGLCWLPAPSALEGTTHATPPKKGREIIWIWCSRPTPLPTCNTNHVPSFGRIDKGQRTKDPVALAAGHDYLPNGSGTTHSCTGQTTLHTALHSWHFTLTLCTDSLYLLLLLLLLLVFSPWAGLGRDQSSVRRLVWLW